MSDANHKHERLSDAFHELGDSLSDFFQTAWESPERLRIQEEIEKGFNQAGNSIHKAAQDFSETDTGQKLKSDLEDIRERIDSGELEEKARTDILEILQKVSSAIEGASHRWKGTDSDSE
ncbi:MAG: hypothetical protein JEZ06_16950 [Anaerolineaceae bacterium]|nr:hypothetical protein [Anaerolineaceae bacterium]